MIKKIISFFQAILIIIYILLEEIVWDNFAKPIYRYLKHLNLFKKLESLLNKQNRYIILILFLLPFILGELLGLFSAFFALKGMVIVAALVYIFKLLIASFSFWLFNVQKEKLLSFKVINYSYTKILKFTNWIKNTEIFIAVKEKIIYVKHYLKALAGRIKRRFLS